MAPNDGNEHNARESFFLKATALFLLLNKSLDVTDANNSTLDIFNSTRKDFLQSNLLDIFPSLTNSDTLNSLQNVLKTNESYQIKGLKTSITNKSGIFNVTAFKVGDEIGVCLKKVKNNRNNATYRLKNLEEENKRLIQQNHELKDMSYILIHDLKGPVSNIQSLVGLIEYYNGGATESKPLFDKIKLVSTQLTNKLKAINTVLSVNSEKVSIKEELDFSAMLKKAQENLSQEIISNRAILKADFSAAPTLFYNEALLETIIQNLISNSIKYKNPKKKPIITIKTKEEDNRIVLSIKDNGLGFDTNNLDMIFGLFKRMHDHVEGQGAGLYIVKLIVTNNGGEINVQSQINKGTEFEIVF